MFQARGFALAIFCLAAAAPTFASEPDESTSLERTREAFRRQLEEARAAGVIAGRERAPPAPTLRDAAHAGITFFPQDSDCLTFERLNNAAKSLANDPVGGLDRLRSSLFIGDDAEAEAAEIALARGYLVLGFAEEARAIAITRDNSEAAGILGIALLAMDEPEDIAEHLNGHERCGALYRLINEGAAYLTGATDQLSVAVKEDLTRLPALIRQPIAEKLAAHSIAKGVDPWGGAPGFPAANDSAEKSEAAAFIAAATEPSAEAAIKKLLPISATPGEFRIDALQKLSTHLDDESPSEIKEAFNANTADVLSDVDGGEVRAKFSLSIARRRIDQGDLTGAAKALAVAYGHVKTKTKALDIHQELLHRLSESTSPDDRLSALSLIVENPQMAAESLPADNLIDSARAVARLGAVQSTRGILSVLNLPAAETALLKGEAAYRAGDFLEARSTLEPIIDEPRGVDLLSRVAILSDDHQLDRRLSTQSGGGKAADFYWRTSDFKALRDLASKSSLNVTTATQALLAHTVADLAPLDTLLESVGDERIASLFSIAPSDASAADAAAEFSENISKSISFLRETLVNE